MKKNLFAVLILISCGLFFLRSLFNPGFPQGHDSEMHLGRMANLYVAVRDQHLPPRWAGGLNYQYGYPIFNFNYYLTEALAIPFFSFGFSIEESLKIICILIMLITPLVWYFFLKPRYGFKPALIASLFSLTAVYPWVNLYVRGSTGEVLVWLLLPLNFYLIALLMDRPNRWTFFLTTGSLTAFLLAHNISVIFGLPFLIGFSLINLIGRKKMVWIVTGLSFFFSLGLTLFFWIPLIAEQQYTIIRVVHPVLRFLDHFPSLGQLFFSKWGYGFSFPGTGDGFSFNLGTAHWLMLILAFFSRLKTKLFWFFLVSFFGFMFMSLSISQWFWLNLPFIYVAQFPWRLLLFMSVAMILPLAAVAKSWPKLSCLLLVIALTYGGIYFNSQGLFHAPDANYFQYPFTTTTENEHKPKWFETDKAIVLTRSFDRVFNVQKANIFLWKTQKHIYEVIVDKPGPVFEKTAYFPGWEVAIDGQPAQIIYEHPDYPGLLGYQLEPGTHHIVSQFTNHTPARQLGGQLSLLSLGLFIFVFLFFPSLFMKLEAKRVC